MPSQNRGSRGPRRSPQGRPLTLATFNVNDIHKRLPNLLRWLGARRPDIVCLQELKAVRLPEQALLDAGYRAVHVGQRSWNGVAILSRGAAPVLTRTALPGDASDTDARYIEAAIDGILVGCLYAPNGNPQPGPKFATKLRWGERLLAHAAGLLAADVPVVLAGDYNVVPTPDDMYPSRASFRDNALVQPEPRAQFRRLLDAGWVDALATTCGEDRAPRTFWSYLRDAWARDRGLRIDHLLLSPALAARLLDGGVDRAVRGEPEASDHAPAWIALRR